VTISFSTFISVLHASIRENEHLDLMPGCTPSAQILQFAAERDIKPEAGG
jgi:hypothetical protein